ncbi:MAG: ArdC-like ssDNA-binding domain-containing protein [Candidatus Treponema excrementipullorum]|nr:ArdC-like ssDNA-binding domain-containing protein [Spirochaetia bacterium]MDY2755989.1 ArdC-like ssDNA-binding domain-containing protein [Candidatus Treponema excrementipullorum]
MSEYNKTNYETIKPFEPTNEIEQGYLDDILSVFENEIKVTGIKEYQSPYSTSKTVLIEYVSHPDFNWREDAVFNLLHDKDILDTSIDYTPITPDKSGTINDYLKRLQEESRFDREIEAFVRGELPDNHVFFLGLPGEILKKCGFPEKNVITLTSSRLKQKSTQENHPFSPLNIKGLDKALQTPIAVFDYARSGNNDIQNVIVDITQDEKHFLAGISFNKKMSGYEVSNIRGLFPKDDYQWLHWVEQGKMIYGNKEKIQALSTQRRIDLAEVSSQDARISSDIHCLDSIDTILGKFGSVNDVFTQEFSFYAQQKEFYSIYRKIHASFAWDAVYEDDARFYAEKIFKAIHEHDTDTLKQYASFEDVYEISDVVREILSEKSGFSTIQSQEQLNKAVSFVTQKKENFMGINEQAQNQNVKNKEEIWTWIHYSDGSGHVRSPDGKKYFVYDWDTKEYRVTPASRWEIYIDVYDPSDKNKTFDDFKKFAEQEIKIKIAKNPNVLFESRHIREEELLEKNIEEQPIHEHERIKIPKQTIQGEKNMEQTEKQTPYYQQQIEKLHEAVKTGTAPFFLKEAVVGENNEVKNPGNYIEDNDKIILTPRPAVRTVKGNLLKGVNQLSAQIELDNMGSKAQTVLSFEDAKEAGTYIKKGSKSILLTGYDKDNERSKVYHVFSAGSVANKDVIKEQLYKNNELNKEKPWSKAIVCTDSNPEKYLGAYLAASASGSVLETDRKTVETFQKNFQSLIEKSISEKKHTAVFDVVRSAQMVKSEILKKNFSTWEKSQEQHKQGQQKKSPQSDMEMVF